MWWNLMCTNTRLATNLTRSHFVACLYIKHKLWYDFRNNGLQRFWHDHIKDMSCLFRSMMPRFLRLYRDGSKTGQKSTHKSAHCWHPAIHLGSKFDPSIPYHSIIYPALHPKSRLQDSRVPGLRFRSGFWALLPSP